MIDARWRRSGARAFAGIATVVLLLGSPPTLGQDRGLRLGAVDVLPQVSASVSYDDNINAVPEGGLPQFGLAKEGDVVYLVSPQVRMQTNARRHRFFVNGRANLGRYQERDNLDYNDWTVESGFRWDKSRTFAVNALVGYDNLHESASDPDRRTFSETTTYDRFRASIALTQDFPRTFVRYNAGVTRTEYQEVLRSVVNPNTGALVTTNVNAGRDVTRLNHALRVGYRLDRQIDAFVQLNHRISEFDEIPGRDRDQQAFGLQVGTAVDLDRRVAGEVSFGVDHTRFDDPRTSAQTGFAFNIGLDWTLTPRTSLGISGSQAFEASDSAASAGSQVTTISTSLSHALSRQITIGANVGYDRESFVDSDRLDETLTAGLSSGYSVNRHVSLQAGYQYTERMSDTTFREYRSNRVFFTVVGRY
ncbi:MAG: outer membrane beta-barrel protein [Pseudomonadota bacterium]